MKLVIVVPCYNEEEVLAETTRQLSSVVDELLSDGKIDEGKILYVDDGSRDRTWELIRGFSETHPSVTGLKLAHNVGHQQALWAGLEWAASHADAAVSIDADSFHRRDGGCLARRSRHRVRRAPGAYDGYFFQEKYGLGFL